MVAPDDPWNLRGRRVGLPEPSLVPSTAVDGLSRRTGCTEIEDVNGNRAEVVYVVVMRETGNEGETICESGV